MTLLKGLPTIDEPHEASRVVLLGLGGAFLIAGGAAVYCCCGTRCKQLYDRCRDKISRNPDRDTYRRTEGEGEVHPMQSFGPSTSKAGKSGSKENVEDDNDTLVDVRVEQGRRPSLRPLVPADKTGARKDD